MKTCNGEKEVAWKEGRQVLWRSPTTRKNHQKAMLHQRYLRNKESVLRKSTCNRLKRKFGISLDEYETRLEAQNGVCKICGQPKKQYRLPVDHCHKTNQIRGIICIRCNLGLATFREDPEILRRAADYLEGGLK